MTSPAFASNQLHFDKRSKVMSGTQEKRLIASGGDRKSASIIALRNSRNALLRAASRMHMNLDERTRNQSSKRLVRPLRLSNRRNSSTTVDEQNENNAPNPKRPTSNIIPQVISNKDVKKSVNLEQDSVKYQRDQVQEAADTFRELESDYLRVNQFRSTPVSRIESKENIVGMSTVYSPNKPPLPRTRSSNCFQKDFPTPTSPKKKISFSPLRRERRNSGYSDPQSERQKSYDNRDYEYSLSRQKSSFSYERRASFSLWWHLPINRLKSIVFVFIRASPPAFHFSTVRSW